MRKKDKQTSTKHYAYNKGSRNTNPTKLQVLRKGRELIFCIMIAKQIFVVFLFIRQVFMKGYYSDPFLCSPIFLKGINQVCIFQKDNFVYFGISCACIYKYELFRYQQEKRTLDNEVKRYEYQ